MTTATVMKLGKGDAARKRPRYRSHRASWLKRLFAAANFCLSTSSLAGTDHAHAGGVFDLSVDIADALFALAEAQFAQLK